MLSIFHVPATLLSSNWTPELSQSYFHQWLIIKSLGFFVRYKCWDLLIQSIANVTLLNALWGGLLFGCLFFQLCHAACGLLVLQPETEPMSPALEVWSPNPWITTEVPNCFFFCLFVFCKTKRPMKNRYFYVVLMEIAQLGQTRRTS